jgi:hypothetical protein
LPSYVTPCYPALAVLVGNLLQRWSAGELTISNRWLTASSAINLLTGILVTGGLGIVLHRLLPGEEWLAGIGLVLVAGSATALACELWWRSRTGAAAISLGTGLLFSLLMFGLGPGAADRHQQSHQLLAALRNAEPSNIAAWQCLEPSWVFYFGRPIRELSENDSAVEFLAGQGRRLVLREEDYASIAGSLPAEVQILARSKRFLRDEELLVVGRTSGIPSQQNAHRPGQSTLK